MMRKVYLDGELGEKFGKVFTVYVKSFKDFFNLLQCNNPEFLSYLKSCEENGVQFFCKIAERPIEQEEEIFLNFNEGDMYISSVPAGSDGLGRILVGAILIIAAVAIALTPGANLYLAAALGIAGATLAISGIAQLLAPDPGTEEGFEQDQSYLFQGSGQTIKQGDPVPLLYGTLRVPGRLIDFDIRNAKSNYIEPQGASNASLNMEANRTSTASSPDTSEVLIGGDGLTNTDIGGGVSPQLPGQAISANIDDSMTGTGIINKFTFGALS